MWARSSPDEASDHPKSPSPDLLKVNGRDGATKRKAQNPNTFRSRGLGAIRESGMITARERTRYQIGELGVGWSIVMGLSLRETDGVGRRRCIVFRDCLEIVMGGCIRRRCGTIVCMAGILIEVTGAGRVAV